MVRSVQDDEADWEVLSRANEKHKFGVPIGEIVPEQIAAACDRGFDNDWWTLIDVEFIAAAPGKLTRIFKLTRAGIARRDELAETFQ